MENGWNRSNAMSNSLENISLEMKSASGKEESVPQRPNILERAKSDSDAKQMDDKNGKNFKYSQRSLRRGSGTGSPNSQLPRYPAFDFSEQEDAHSFFSSPSEPEANRNIKSENSQNIQKSGEAVNKDASQNRLHLKETSQKKRDSSKSKTLMPELMENSETESTKGSFECEAPDLPSSSETSAIPVPDIAFPSLPNTFLAKLGVHKDSPIPVEAFDEKDLESKFIALSLAFKTDRPTLSKRFELHKRQRDMAEKNVESEFQAMREHLKALNLKATSSDVRDLISKIQNHLDIAQQATARVSGRSETYGAVQQEERVSRAFEVLVLHVDHLKRLFDKEHKELEETRRMLTDTRVFRRDISSDVVPEDQKKYSKTFGLPVGSIKSIGRRRASVAEFHQRSFLENCKSPGFSQSWTSGLNTRKVEQKQYVYPNSTNSAAISNSISQPTSPETDISKSPSRTHISEAISRRRSLPASSPMAPNNLLKRDSLPSDTPQASLFPPKHLSGKQERNIWTRKLSAVTDEKEQSEEESETTISNKVEEPNKLQVPHQESLRFLLQVEKKNNTIYQIIDDQSHEETDLSDEPDSVDEISNDFATHMLQIIQKSAIGKYLHIPAVHELWQQNSTWILIRYLCSCILIFVSLCFLLSMILSCSGIHISFEFATNICAGLLSFVIL